MSMIRPLSACHIICKPGSKELLVAATYEGLKDKFINGDNVKKDIAVNNNDNKPVVCTPPAYRPHDYYEDDVYYPYDDD